VTCQARRRALEGAQSSEDVDKAKMDNWQAAGQGRSSRAGPQQQQEERKLKAHWHQRL